MTDAQPKESPDGAGSGCRASGPRRDASWFLAIFLVALALRGIYVYQVRACPFYGHEIMDAKYHREWAEAFASGETFVEGPYFRAPLYPWTLGMIYRLFGQSDLAPRIVQIVVGSLSCGLVFLIGRDAFNRRVGVLAGFAAATYWLSLYFEAELLIVWLAVFLDLLLVWLLVWAFERQSLWTSLLAGAMLGLSAIAVPSILLFAPVVLAWLLLLHRASVRRVLSHAASFVVGCALFIAPVTVRNYVVGHDLVLISSSAGVNFYIGNNQESDGMTAVVPGTPGEWWAGYHAQIERAEKATGRSLKASEVSQYYFREALRFMREQPVAAATLMLRKLGLFWSRREVSNNQDIGFVTDNFTPIVKWLPLRFSVVAPFGLLGLALSFREARRLFPLWGFVLTYMIGVVAFFISARYRFPVVPVLLVLASYAAIWCWETIRARRWRSVGLAVAVLVPAAALVAHKPEGEQVGKAASAGSAGMILLKQGKTADAEKYFVESVRLFPADAQVWYGLATIKLEQGDLPQAEQCLEQALEYDPAYPHASELLGVVLARQGRIDDAIERFREALAASPEDGVLHSNLGGVLIQRGKIDEGLPILRKGIWLDPETIDRVAALARDLANGGRFADARRVLETGLAASPDNVSILVLLAQLLAVCPDPAVRDGETAVRHAERACELTEWSDPRVLETLAVSYHAAGQVDRALETARRALSVAEQHADEELARRIRGRIQAFESEQ